MSGGSGVPSTSFLASADYGDPNADAASGNVAGGEAGYYGGGGGGFGGGDYFDDGGGQRGGGTTMAGGPGRPAGVGVGGDPYYGVDAVDPAAGGVVPPQQQPQQRQQQLRQQQQQRWMTDDDDGDVDPRLSTLPRILLMGPRRAGKTSIQRVVFNKMSPHETLFRLEATQGVERTVVNEHAALSRFAMWDFPGDYYGGGGGGVGGVGGPGGTAMMGSHQPGGATMMGGAGGTSPHGGYHEQQQQQGYPTHQHGGGVPRHEMDGGGGGYPPPPPVPVPGADDGDDANDYYSDAAPAAQLEAEAAAREAAHAAAEAEEEADRRIYSGSASKTCLIFVMDAQDEPYDHVLQNFTHTVTRAVRANPSISIEVFINKVDGELFLSDEAKYDCRRDIMQQVSDELHDAGFGGGDGGEDEFDPVGSVNYHLTSIYDHSIFEAFSRVVQKLIPHLQPTLENLLNVLVSSCAMEKAYLFDVASKLYISTDSSPVDMQSVELCSDMIDVVLDVSGIYGTHTTEGGGGGGGATDADGGAPGGGPLLTDGGVGEDLTSAAHPPPADDGFGISSVDATATSSVAAGSLPGPSTSASGGADTHALEEPPDGTTVAPLVEGDGSAGAGEGGGDGGGGGLGGEAARSSSASELEPGFGPGDDGIGDGDYNIEGGEVGSSPAPETAPEETSAYDDGSSSVIRLSNGMVLYLREVDSMLALVCLTRCENFRKRSLIDYNISRLKRALKSLVVAVPPASSAPSTPLDGTASSGMNGSAPSAVGR